jgi:hypothetical protein
LSFTTTSSCSGARHRLAQTPGPSKTSRVRRDAIPSVTNPTGLVVGSMKNHPFSFANP